MKRQIVHDGGRGIPPAWRAKMESAKDINAREAEKIIHEEGLQPIDDLWHFTFNIERYYKKFLYIPSQNIVTADENVGPWSPRAVFTLNGRFVPIQYSPVKNHLKPDTGDHTELDKCYWYITPLNKFESFDAYLEYKTINSSKPKKHYPTTYTYKKLSKNINASLTLNDLDVSIYKEIENKYKRDGHNGIEVYLHNPRIGCPDADPSWLKMAILHHGSDAVACGLIVDDGISYNLVNIAAKRSRYSYGVMMCVELTKSGFLANRKTFDCGISKDFGCYKKKIFSHYYEIYDK